MWFVGLWLSMISAPAFASEKCTILLEVEGMT